MCGGDVLLFAHLDLLLIHAGMEFPVGRAPVPGGLLKV
jgi:hypothetical protein